MILNYSSAGMISWGKFFFKHRSITPIPLLLLVFIWSFFQKANYGAFFYISAGIFFVVIGEGIRMACVSKARSITRTRSDKTGGRLITGGLYRLSRNPIYIGNFFIGLGIMLFSEIALAPLVFAAVFLLQYIPIIAYEEAILQEKFGREYEVYRKLVPRWLGFSKLPAADAAITETYSFYKVLKSESSTLTAIVVLTVLMNAYRFF